MSYEGYERVLCRNGHLEEAGCYDSGFLDEDWRCRHCGEPRVWWEGVDQTNDAGVETHLQPYLHHRCCCNTCGNEHETAPTQYCIPAKPSLEDPAVQRALPHPPLVPVVRCGRTVLETGEHFDTDEAAWQRHEELWRQRDQQHRETLRELGLPDRDD